MPEYLAPGVFVEETSFRQKTIEGVGTSTTGFAGPCRFGPTHGEPELLTSFADFERIFGGIDRLRFTNLDPSDNYVAHAVRAYFEEGGRQLYVARVCDFATAGTARWSPGGPSARYELRARHPGAHGNFRVTLVFRLGDEALDHEPVDPSDPDGVALPVLRGVSAFDVVMALETGSSPAAPGIYWVERFFDVDLDRFRLRLRSDDPDENPMVSPSDVMHLSSLASVRRLTLSVLIDSDSRFGNEKSWDDLSLHPQSSQAITRIFAAEPDERSTALYVPLVFDPRDMNNGAEIARALTASNNLIMGASRRESIFEALTEAMTFTDGEHVNEARRSFRVELSGGTDGNQPGPDEYSGAENGEGLKSGLLAFEAVDDISIAAVPGSSFDYSDIGGTNHAEAIARRLISHCERMRYRIAVLDSVNGATFGEVREYKSRLDSTRAALYYPWIRTFDPLTEQSILVPPSGSVCGIYARSDMERGVHQAPANEVVRLADGLEISIDTAQQEVLNPLGINCLRFFDGRGYRIWGARTASSDPEWKYLNVRRYLAFLERSIERGTRWAVFENNGEVLWADMRRTIEDFLFNEWRRSHLFGQTPDQAFFVRCDRTTMTQNDFDNGRLICLIGVALLRPAEFLIFRFGQKTADSR